MATSVSCVSCGRGFDVADDDPLWSITTAPVDPGAPDGARVIVGCHVEPPCPHCGTVSLYLPPGLDAPPSGAVVDSEGNVQRSNRVDQDVARVAYDPGASAAEQAIPAEAIAANVAAPADEVAP